LSQLRQSHRALNATSTDFAKEEILSYQQTTVEWQTKCEALQQERDVLLAQTNELAFNKDLQVHQQGRNATLEKEVLKLRSSLAVHVEELKNVSQLLEVNGRYKREVYDAWFGVKRLLNLFILSLLSSRFFINGSALTTLTDDQRDHTTQLHTKHKNEVLQQAQQHQEEVLKLQDQHR
jgi:hypothetical protein